MRAAGALARRLSGRWELVRYDVAVGDRPFSPILGDGVTGELRLADDGRISVIIIRDPLAVGMPDALAYAGSYRLAGRDLVMAIEVASLPAWRGTTQRRHIELRGNILTLTSRQASSSVSPTETSRGRAVWRRIVEKRA